MWLSGLVAIASAPAPASAATAAPSGASVATASASTAAASESTASATATAAPTSAAAASTEAAFFAGTGFVDGQGSAAMFLAIKGLDGGLRLIVVGHLDESKALAAAGVTIVDHLRRKDLIMLPEQLFEL
jgi:hypothetical protein